MQLQGATELEIRLYHLCVECETTLGCSDFATRLSVGISNASNELQALRWQVAELEQQLRDSQREICGATGIV